MIAQASSTCAASWPPDSGLPFVGESGRLAAVPRDALLPVAARPLGAGLYRVRLDGGARSSATRSPLRNQLYYTDLDWDSDGTLLIGAFPFPAGGPRTSCAPW